VSLLLVEKFKRERLATPVVRVKKVNGVETRTEKEKRPATVNRELACLSKVFSMAQDAGLIADNPCCKVKKLREDNRRERVLSSDEEARLLAVCTGPREHLKPIIVLAVNTGMRRGDLLGLTWSRVDFERGLIFVPNHKAGDGRGHWLPMNSVVRSELVALSFQRRDDQRVFGVGDIKTAWKTARRLAGIEGLRLHDLRHTAATRLADAGCDAFTIAAILGHSSIQMSARYTHASDERKRRALEAIVSKPESPVTIWSIG
jgi:integrase